MYSHLHFSLKAGPFNPSEILTELGMPNLKTQGNCRRRQSSRTGQRGARRQPWSVKTVLLSNSSSEPRREFQWPHHKGKAGEPQICKITPSADPYPQRSFLTVSLHKTSVCRTVRGWQLGTVPALLGPREFLRQKDFLG